MWYQYRQSLTLPVSLLEGRCFRSLQFHILIPDADKHLEQLQDLSEHNHIPTHSYSTKVDCTAGLLSDCVESSKLVIL